MALLSFLTLGMCFVPNLARAEGGPEKKPKKPNVIMSIADTPSNEDAN